MNNENDTSLRGIFLAIALRLEEILNERVSVVEMENGITTATINGYNTSVVLSIDCCEMQCLFGFGKDDPKIFKKQALLQHDTNRPITPITAEKLTEFYQTGKGFDPMEYAQDIVDFLGKLNAR